MKHTSPQLKLKRASSMCFLVTLYYFHSQLLAGEFNYEESKVPEYTLPDPLKTLDNIAVKSSRYWLEKRRPEVLKLFQKYVYGHSPMAPENIAFEVFEQGRSGNAIRKQVAITVTAGEKSQRFDMLLFLPAETEKPSPVFLLLNFMGNHATHSDPAIVLPKSVVLKKYSPAEKFRGEASGRFPVEAIVARGYGIATIYCGDIDPDYDDEFKNGVHALYNTASKRPGDAWGTLGAWAWGLSRAMDYFENDVDVDPQHIAVLGHSRLGKTALWAGAQDDRFALVISNDSGCGGAALSRRRYGETIKRINHAFPHWFCENFKQYNDNEDALPVDQHMLLALVAPRPVYVASATEDQWADPRGEFLSCVHAEPVYQLLGFKGLEQSEMPEPDRPIQVGQIGYHIRTGDHQLADFDWQAYMDFADKHWRNSEPISAAAD